VAYHREPLRTELADRFRRFAEILTAGGVARRLQREGEALRHGLAPTFEQGRRLKLVISRVDLGRAQLRGCIFELLRLREPRGIEGPAPRIEVPAADADMDLSRHVGAGNASDGNGQWPDGWSWLGRQDSNLRMPV